MHVHAARAGARANAIYCTWELAPVRSSRAPVQLQSETCFDLRALGHVEFDLFAAHYFEFDLRALGHSGFHQCR